MKPHRSRCALVLQLLVAGAATLLAGIAAQAQAQAAYPDKPIRLVIPFPAGGAVDTFARIIGPELGHQLGQPIVILNKPGGGSQIAANDLLAQPADGYTVFVAQGGDFTVNPVLYRNLSYNPARDFESVAIMVKAPSVMLGNVAGKIRNVETLKQAMAPGSSVLYGSYGPGTAPHLLGHMLSKKAPGANFTHVPYKGFPPAMQALMTNEIDLLFDGIPGTLNMMRTGKIVPIAVADTQRNPNIPDVPTTAEIGLPQIVNEFWIAAAVKKGTPRAIVSRLHDAFEKAVASPENAKKFTEIGYTRVSMTPERLDAYIQSETAKIRPVIVDTGVVVD
ncbi:tripartite-type tricarboxylate transporter receptor subunit TctC [Pseudacidovorax sp. 1753]|uniref:Bug family tripartite tricarboxylate transporter substrate binding protein n=1 Tax=Pseudacidovorax sp. 1753 TaxID=3156419 RepID=UPI0033918931